MVSTLDLLAAYDPAMLTGLSTKTVLGLDFEENNIILTILDNRTTAQSI